MILVVILLIYLAGFSLFCYLSGRFAEGDMAALGLLWPLWLVVAPFIVAMVYFSNLGERHNNEKG